ncbi:MAG: efflux transporter outer membrane subunit [Desulfobulbus sp.]|nr:efflux transporter outer membrane subunit [Desulfobulbus sp.]
MQKTTGQVVFFAVMLMTMGACTSMAPHYERPGLPVPAAYSEATEAALPSGPSVAMPTARAAELGWRDYFTDSQLRDLIDQALQNNRDLRLAALRIEEARAVYQIERSALLPTVGVSAGASRARLPGDLSPLGRAMVSSQYQADLGLASWEIDLWGRIRSLKDAALESYLASEEAHCAVTLSLIAQVAQTWLGLRELDERITLARQTVDSRAESLRIFRRRVEVGATSKLDLTQVEVLWQQACTLLSQLEQQQATQGHALELLLGTAPRLSAAAKRSDDQELLRELMPGLPADLLENRPDIIAAEHRLKAANANIGAARAAFFPQVTLTGAFGTASSQLDGLFASGSRAWNYAPNISLPIFDSGLRRANLELNEVRRDQAVAQYEQSIQQAFRDVLDALSTRRALEDQVRTLRATQAAQDERARLARLRYDNGAAAFLEVLDAERDQLAVQQLLVQTRHALLASRVGLYAALGGGSRITKEQSENASP